MLLTLGLGKFHCTGRGDRGPLEGRQCWLEPSYRQFGLNLKSNGKPLDGFKLVKWLANIPLATVEAMVLMLALRTSWRD